MAFEYVIVDFDENALTGTATTETVTDDPDLRLILAGSEEELTVYDHRSGMWHTDDECWSDANS